MNGPTLQVQMLGQFTLRYGDRTISDSDDRSRRVWSLLAYMLYNHGRSFAQEELIHLTLNSLPEVQGVRVEAHLILGKSYRQIAREQGVDKSAVRHSVKSGKAAMRKYLKKIL